MFHLSIATTAVGVAFLCQHKSLPNCLSFSIYCSLNKRLSIVEITILFIQLGKDKRSQAISKVLI